MTKQTILIYPDRRLKTAAAEVQAVTENIRSIAADMLETMYAAPGIGLAGPQIGVMRRILVMDCSAKDDEKDSRILINPSVLWLSEETDKREEGCLSMPNHFADVERPVSVRVAFKDADGANCEETYHEIWARCAQHEIDHLNGILFIDRITLIKRQMIRRKLVKVQQRKATDRPVS